MTNRRYESVQSYLFNNRNNKIDAHQFFERVDTAEAQIIKNNIYDNTVVLNRDVLLNILKLANDVFDNKAYMYVDDSEVSRHYNAVVKMKRLVIGVRDPSLRQSLYNTIAYIERLLNIGTVNDSEITMLIADFYDLYSNYNIELPPPQALPRSRRPSVVQPAAPAPVPTIVREQTKPEQIIPAAPPPPPSPVPNIPAPPPPPPPSMSELPPAPPMPTEPQPAAPLDDRQQLLEAIRNEKNRTRLRPVKPKTAPETSTIVEVPTVLPKETFEPKPPSASPPPPPPPPPPPAPPAPPPMVDLSSAPPPPPLVDLPSEMLPPPAPSLSNVLSELKSGTVRLKPAQKRPQSEIIPKSSTTNLIADVLADTINRRRVAMAKSSSEATSNDEGWDDDDNRPNKANTPDVKYVQALFNVFTSSQLYTNDSDERNTKAHNILNDVEPLLQNKTQTNIDKARLLLQDLASFVALSENPLDSPAIGSEKQPLFETNRNLFYKSIEDLIFKFRYKDAENHLIFALTYHPKDYKFNELLKYVQQLSVNQQRTESSA
ncbi:viral capsid associated protein [Autographa californica nucleopolyhedrovirus]|uniref:Protein P78/83 n=2 Tax=Autographa californica nuclear polyhedrosis virus TaxID=46015 RepID=P78_NPVAC|nr:viral capsid associated protein [Autographa californica nucleopolyhedrovirus]Q03209.2 RecName: Full=Protein P78/83 [Autographa californica nucleopolyhedrovirus]AKN58862.1 viral capsid associated protein [Autographa californica multiple nucleopolyhedrovirus]ARJ58695.1 viral capsid associated protein [synthetic baculovirus AcMNPV-WIV-Syn1]UVY87275.1 pp78/83 [synthetic construct]AAA46705.1 ORF8 [Autographa californica nucleopolyhedrovirus]AAA66639.1 viral capsid associated protein [Autographa